VRTSTRIAGFAGGLVGLAATGFAVAAATRTAARHASIDPYVNEPLGDLPPDHQSTVGADDGVPLSVEEIEPAGHGKAELTVVYVHGFSLSRRCWHFQRRDLAQLRAPAVRQVLYDQRNHGFSGRGSPESADIEQLGKDLDAVLRAVVPSGPIVLVGHSMGGMTIMALAEQQPELFADRVRGVALISTSAGEVGRQGLPRSALSRYNPVTRGVGQLAEWQPRLVELVRHAGDGVTRRAVRRLAFGTRDVSPTLVSFMVRMLAVSPVGALTDFLDTLGSHNRYAALAGLKHCQVLVISGDEDRMTPYSHSERIAAELPEAELVRVPGCGHMVMMEEPDFVNASLIGLLQRCTGKLVRLRRWARRDR
jgi:pimeloyl-ACP methyl ester carboxylesterase